MIAWLENCMSWLGWVLLTGDVLLVGVLWFYEFGPEVFNPLSEHDLASSLHPADKRVYIPGSAERWQRNPIGGGSRAARSSEVVQ